MLSRYIRYLESPFKQLSTFLKFAEVDVAKKWWCCVFCNYKIQSNLAIRNGSIRKKLVLRNHFLWPICHLLHKDKELLALRNNFRVTKKFLIAKFDCIIIKEAAATIKRQASLLKNYVKTLLTKYEFGKILWFFLFYITASKKSCSKIVPRKRIKENIWYLLGTYAVRTDRKNVTNFLYLVLHLAHKVTLFSSVLVSVLRTSINVLSKCKSRNYVTWIANLTKLFLSV